MTDVVNIVGNTYGRWTVLKQAPVRKTPKGANRYFWLCRCECGGEKEVDGVSLKSGESKSCGCLFREVMAAKTDVYHNLYGLWCNMRSRCQSPSNTSYQRYGGRGIFVCPEWNNSFSTFVSDMGPRPTPQHSVERRDNDGPYAPWNCVWATKSEQANNRSSGALITYQGQTKTVAQWSVDLGVSYHTLYKRVFVRGWSAEEAFNTPHSQRISQTRKVSK